MSYHSVPIAYFAALQLVARNIPHKRICCLNQLSSYADMGILSPSTITITTTTHYKYKAEIPGG